MGKGWCVRGALLVTVVSVSVAVPATGDTATVTRAAAVPAKLVGVWNRNVTVANWSRYSDVGIGPTGVWTMVIKQGGGVDFYTPNGYRAGCVPTRKCYPDFSDRFTVAGARLTASPVPPDCPIRGLYTWKTSRTVRLTLGVITDKECLERAAILAGSWKHA